MIVEAIKKEVARGGQVYYLYNRVSGIYRVAEKLSALLPDIKIVVGHGQMNQDMLEDIMMDMVAGDIDVMVCTTIIETGLDIPNVNTIIIEDADRMVTAGFKVADVVDDSQMKLTIPFLSDTISGIFAGQSAEVSIVGTFYTLTGTVSHEGLSI